MRRRGKRRNEGKRPNRDMHLEEAVNLISDWISILLLFPMKAESVTTRYKVPPVYQRPQRKIPRRVNLVPMAWPTAHCTMGRFVK